MMKKTPLFALALIAAAPVDGVAQDGLDSDTTVRELFGELRAAHIDATAIPFPEKYLVAEAGPFSR